MYACITPRHLQLVLITTRYKINPLNKCERFEQIRKFSEIEKERVLRRFQARTPEFEENNRNIINL